ncbi:hypothetical protein CON17_19755 [Bacillus thuringiensis]|uniref:hypothetical protein n=1 Tax=Bacillus thuringiensis TaxID=1428 RepID=UPI000BED75D9|nr:hypothetical protein [Bacillus thuringiensis]PEC95138.1 hypothetical protein CON17_19755 [Bacillus thuringiensis]HDR8240506.1 hypothetical protein [Bacillus cereus]
MSNFEQYENLPGVKVSYEDGNLYTGKQVEDSRTQAILIMGTAIDGPVGEPVSVNQIGGPKAAEKMFGGLLEKKTIVENGVEKTVRVPHQGTLIRAMWEAIRAGNEDIRLLRISGKTAMSEILAKDENSEVTEPLADMLGNNLIPGNVAFTKRLNIEKDQRLVKIEKIEEFEGTDTAVDPVKTFPDSTGYQNVDITPGSEIIYFTKDKFRPKNTIKVIYKAKKRNYSEVTRNMDGKTNSSTLGLLTQNPTMTNYFSSEVGNWSDEPIHQVNVYTKDAEGRVNAIPMVNTSGERLWRIGKGDSAVKNELTDIITAEEYKQGGIRFTEAYQQEVAKGIYPALTAALLVVADYFYYNDLEIQKSDEYVVPGAEKESVLKHTPVSDSLEVYYELNGKRITLKPNDHFTVIYPDGKERIKVMIKAGVAPVGAKLFAHYKTGEGATQGAKISILGKHGGKVYGGIQDIRDFESLYGVKYTVEYEVNENGTLDMDNRVVRFIKPSDKKLTSNDTEIRFRTKEMRGIRTIREFANYINSLPQNNIVRLEVPVNTGDVAITGLMVTDYNVSPIDGRYDYRPINLGEKYNEDEGKYSLYVDDNKAENDAGRFQWLGGDGFYDTTNLMAMKELYDSLGGKYELVPATLDEYDLVEQGIYSKLENYSVDLIWLCDAFANTTIGAIADDGSTYIDNNRNFATQLAQHCAMVSAKTYETIGVIGVAPAPEMGLREVQQYIDLLTKGIGVDEESAQYWYSRGINPNYLNAHYMYNLATNERIFNDEGEPIDIGRYANVVFGPETGLAHEKLGTYIASGAGIYAALISQLRPEVSTTNKPIAVSGLRYNLSEAQHNQLAGGHYVTFENKVSINGNRSVVVKDGVTAAGPMSDYQRLSTVRITHATVQVIRKLADKFIGLPNGVAQRNSLATEIQAGLDKLKDFGVLTNFKFSIFTSAKDRVLGNAYIQLELVPAYETRKIYTSVALRASL